MLGRRLWHAWLLFMSDANALVLVMDGLGSGNLGPYGNTWLETPAWNRLAARSTLVETAVVDTIDLASIYRSYLTGQHALVPEAATPNFNLAAHLGNYHVESWLVTDDPRLADQAIAQEFSRRVILPAPTAEDSVDAVEDTHLASFFASLIGVLEQAEPPFLIWAHAQALRGPWDAPYELRSQFAEEGDPDPPRFVEPPDYGLPPDYDPDELLGCVHANAGQVAVLDVCLGVLLDALATHALDESTAVLATSNRGFPLGEQLWVGPTDRTLSGNLVQVPWIMQLPGQNSYCQRLPWIAQPPDLCATVLEWFQLTEPLPEMWGRSLLISSPSLSPTAHDRAVTIDDDQRMIRVPHWALRLTGGDSEKLFVKPDDRWEVNEVSDRCPAEVELLRSVLSDFEQAAVNGDLGRLSALPDKLH
jgi:arylsulfatase A-like enzyme